MKLNSQPHVIFFVFISKTVSMHTDDKDGACHVVREFNDIVVVITVFALLI